MVGLIFGKVGIILGEEIFDRSSSRWPSLDGIPFSLSFSSSLLSREDKGGPRGKKRKEFH